MHPVRAAIPAIIAVVMSCGCVVAGGAGATTRAGPTRPVAQVGVQAALVLPAHVGPLVGLAYRTSDGDGATLLQAGARFQRYQRDTLAPRGVHGRLAVQRVFDGERSAIDPVAAIGYHWDVLQVELEYVRERGESDVCVLVGLDIGKILGGSSGGFR